MDGRNMETHNPKYSELGIAQYASKSWPQAQYLNIQTRIASSIMVFAHCFLEKLLPGPYGCPCWYGISVPRRQVLGRCCLHGRSLGTLGRSGSPRRIFDPPTGPFLRLFPLPPLSPPSSNQTWESIFANLSQYLFTSFSLSACTPWRPHSRRLQLFPLNWQRAILRTKTGGRSEQNRCGF